MTGLAIGAFIAALALALLWWLLAAVISADRGLDVTDEGLYLLAADPPSPTAAFLFPWGWHTQPLLRLVGYDLAAFRTGSALILVVAAGLMAAACATYIERTRRVLGQRRPRDLVVGLVGVAGVAASSLMLYTSLLRGPGYYWVNLVGVIITTGSVVALAASVAEPGPVARRWRAHSMAGTAAFGMFLTLPAKPSSPILLASASLCFLAVSVGMRESVRWVAEMAAFSAGWLLVAVVSGTWPVSFVEVFVRQLGVPLESAQTVPVAVANFVRVPATFVAQLAHWPDWRALVIVACGVAILGVSLAARRRWKACVLAGFTCVVAGSVILALSNSSTSDFARALYAPTTTSALIVVGAAVFSAARSSEAEGTGRWGDGPTLRRRVALVLLLSVMPFVFAFGTYNGTYPMGGLAVGFLVAAAVSALLSIGSFLLRGALIGTLVAGTLIIVSTTMVRSHDHPYRQSAMDEQTVPVAVGARGATLLLDPQRATALRELERRAAAAGWRAGTPLLDLSWGSHAGVVYALGARAPESLIPALLDATGGSLDRFRYLLGQPYRDFPFEQAWVLSSSADVLDAVARPVIDSAAAALAQVTGRTFPDSYSCVASIPSMTNDPSDSLTLWRPNSKPSTGPSTRRIEGDPFACRTTP